MSELRIVDPDSPQLRESAGLMLRRHEEVAPEADVRSAIANFLVTDADQRNSSEVISGIPRLGVAGL